MGFLGIEMLLTWAKTRLNIENWILSHPVKIWGHLNRNSSPEDLPEAMNDREKWRERVRDIRASGTIWWWWWWWLWLDYEMISIFWKYPVYITFMNTPHCLITFKSSGSKYQLSTIHFNSWPVVIYCKNTVWQQLTQLFPQI